ncbi:MAG: ABC transporter ATP-binding protein [Clostridiales bacterium GWF2_36_10]|nr:MAG: ABC transporter ATP-binding protein [Clostridiales bacterium GWF2_36_10]HAN21766.1 ABC transporter ATP-binding protein [Clostridiales bacterium]
MSVIEIKKLSRNYGGGRGVFDLSFSVEQGEVFGFLGPNGAGKTTAIRHLMGFLKPQKGECLIDSKDCFSERDKIQAKVGYIPGEIAFIDNMTGYNFIKFYAELRKQNNINKAKLLMDRFELDANGKLKKMSKGTKQKVGIVCAFMSDADIYILDEPTSGLDPLMQNTFIDLVNEEKKKGKTILMSSHLFEEVERTCSRVGIIKQGKLAAIDEIETLKKQKIRRYVITLPDFEQAAAFWATIPDLGEVDGNKVKITIKHDIRPLIEAMYKYPVLNIESVNQSLEDVFLHYYGGKKL